MPSVETADPRVVLSSVRTGAGPAAGHEARTALWLLGVAGAVLLIGCANVANLSLSRSLRRRREVGVKRALGISSRRLVVGVYAEAALLAIGAGVASLAVAQATRTALRDDDSVGAPAVAVVSESMARLLWPGREAIGACFHMRTVDSPCRTVVGIAEDIVQRELAGGRRLHYYVPIDQYPRTFGNGLLVKLRDAPARAGEEVRVALQRALAGGSYLVAQPLADVVVDQQASWRMGASVLSGFGLLALLVAGVGLFGSVSYDIAQRSREWAVRVALGADPAAIVSMILSRSLGVVLAGVVPGLLLAAGLGRWIQPLLYRTSPFDPLTFTLAAGLMVIVAISASTWPALRAAGTDPNAALRSE